MSSHAGLSQASSRVPAFPPTRGGIRWGLHFTPRPRPCHHRPGRNKPRAGSLCSTTAPADHQTWLCDSVRPMSPQLQGHPVHFNQGRRCPCLACRSHSLAGERCDRAGPSSRYEVRVLQPLLHCAQQKRWVTTDHLRVLIRALYKLPFKTLTQKHIFERVPPLDWFAAINLKDACFHDSILPRHRAFLQFAFEGRACQYKLLPFGHLSQLGFQVNWGKSKLDPSWIRSARPRNVLSRCWTASRLYQAGRWSHWNSFRGSWGIWLQLRQ